jgi:hypothetical protein
MCGLLVQLALLLAAAALAAAAGVPRERRPGRRRGHSAAAVAGAPGYDWPPGEMTQLAPVVAAGQGDGLGRWGTPD